MSIFGSVRLLALTWRNKFKPLFCKIEIIACRDLLEELRQTLQRPKFKKYLSSERMLLAIELVEQSSTFINLQSVIELCRDNKDDYLLALAKKDAQADFLLTGDKDLLVLNPFEKTQVKNLRQSRRLENVNRSKRVNLCTT